MLATSETLDKFGAAMAKVQEEIGGAVKGNVNPAFRSKYADLGAVWDAWQAIGPKHGFSVMQFPGLYDANAKTMAMDQLVTHSSGQWVRSELSVPLSKADAQGYGSATTYARRYSLAATVGICPEDDDGNAASRPPANDRPADRQAQPDAQVRKMPPPLKGPIKTRAELRIACGNFVRELKACGDDEMLSAFLEENRALVRQVEDEAEFFWLGDGADFIGMKREIEEQATLVGADDSWRTNVLRAG